MKKQFLEDCLAQGMSLEAIGEKAEKHPSTVGYWLKRNGLSACNADRHAPKGVIERGRLEPLVDAGLTFREIATRLDRSVATVRYWMGKYELRTIRRRLPRSVDSPKRVQMKCPRHGSTEFVLEGRGYYRCVSCRAEAVTRRRRSVKRKLVEEAGGRCMVCSYSRCQQALQFHHLDPGSKEFHLGQQGQSRSLARSRAEARKCVLLCANCHAEVEAGFIELSVDSKMEV
jgi:hypothetical protein